VNSFGRSFRLALFGESHGEGIGVVVDGVPPGLAIDARRLQADLDRRRPGRGPLVSQRREQDKARILSGTKDGRATGTPLAIWIENHDVQGKPYAQAAGLPRPGHADFVNHLWSRGHADLRGGGHSSGRLTAPLVAAGSIAEGLLVEHGIRCGASLQAVGDVEAPAGRLSARQCERRARRSPVFTAYAAFEGRFSQRIEEARRAKDSVGGVVEFVAEGVPPALGDPFFDAVESQLAHLLFAVPAVKGVEFGEGFRAASMLGSQHNDPFTVARGKVRPASNRAGGILGGRTTGEAIRGRVAVKPASSIFLPQDTVDLTTKKPAKLALKGRHDPCIAIRAVPVVEACVRLVLADFVLLARQQGHLPVPGGAD
jgi:chorismate synthase